MSDHDKKLIEEAWALHYVDWYYIDDMIERAESQEAKDRLKSIRSNKYHTEEYHAGCL